MSKRLTIFLTLLLLFPAAVFIQHVTGQLPQRVVLPELPDKLDFAGEKVPPEYFAVRESLQ